MVKKIKSHAKRVKRHFRPAILVFVVVFALIGSYFIFHSLAATFATASEAESGTIAGNASKFADTNASGGNAVQFSSGTTTANATNPCVGAAKPTQWKHVVVLMFENHTYNTVVGSTDAPYITNLVHKCASAPNAWYDADFKSPGVRDGTYVSKPNYATLTSGVSPSVHGLTDDSSGTRTTVDNIYRQLRHAGKSAKDYFDATGANCSASFAGDYHDAMRYYNGDSGADLSYCQSNDVPLSNFWTDLNNNTLPSFSMILPTNCENGHSCSTVTNVTKNSDTWASNFLPNFFNSARYKSGDTAFFFVWDEDTNIPNVLCAPSIKVGVNAPSTSHFGATRTWDEMLGLPYLGVTNNAPHPSEDLLATFNGQ